MPIERIPGKPGQPDRYRIIPPGAGQNEFDTREEAEREEAAREEAERAPPHP